MFSPASFLLGGVVSLAELVYAVSFVAIIAMGLAIAFLGMAGVTARRRKSVVYRMLTALPGSIVGVTFAHHLFWRSYSSTPALVWYICGILLGGIVSLFLSHFILLLASRFRNSG